MSLPCCEVPANCGLKRIFWTMGVVLAIGGLVGWVDRLVYGHLHANYGSVVTWGLWVAAYIYFIGLSAGAFLLSSLVYVFRIKQFEPIGRVAVFTAIVTLFLALLSIWADLGHMSRAWEVLWYANFKSPMAWMIWLYSAYFLLLLAEMWFLLRADLIARASGPGRIYRALTFGSTDLSLPAQSRDRRIVRILAIIGIPLATMFHGGVGALFGVIAARPHWHSGLFPILFLLSALVSGGALLIVIAAVFQRGWEGHRTMIVTLGKLVLGLFLLDILFQFSELLIAWYGAVPGHIAGIQLAMFGPYWWVYWVWQVGVGTIIPAALLAGRTRQSPRWVALAAVLIVLGFIGVRLNIVIPGLAVEEIAGLTAAYSSTRVTMHYFPSITEWLLLSGIVGIGLLLFGGGELLLPKSTDTEGTHVRLR